MDQSDPRVPLVERIPPVWRNTLVVTLPLAALVTLFLVARVTNDAPVLYSSPEDHFKYGSTGGERASGFPYWVWKALPSLFPEHLPGGAYQAATPYAPLGFLYEKNADGTYKDLPIGVSRRNVQGLDRVFLNCAICHAGTVRATAESTPRVVLGMPSNTVDLQAFQRFIFASATDERFNADRILGEIKKLNGLRDLGFLNERALRKLGITLMRDRLLLLRHRFQFVDREPDFGPGRVDTFNAPKVLLNFRMDLLPEREWVGNCDFPSVWMQAPKQGMQLHWDGNNDQVEERNRSAAFGTGSYPPTLDRPAMRRVEDWLKTLPPPEYRNFFTADLEKQPAEYRALFEINDRLAARGKELYGTYCARCHGVSGRDFRGEKVGTVEPILSIKTDRWRLDSYTYELAAAQNQLYAGYGEERFSHFRKTFGYANMPLDGIWLRAPYLHNGSVPTLRDLLNDAGQRPKVFYRGYDLFDPKKVGFVSDVPEETAAGAAANPHLRGRAYFRFDTQPIPASATAACAKITAVHPDTCEVEVEEPLPANIRKLKIVSSSEGGPPMEEVLVARRDQDGRRLTIKSPADFPERLKTVLANLKPGDLAEYSTPRDRNEGNSNAGHEGEEYGTKLPDADKDAIVEYLKTF